MTSKLSKALILLGNSIPVVAFLMVSPDLVEASTKIELKEQAFVSVMLSLAPVLLIAALGALLTFAGGLSLLIDAYKSKVRIHGAGYAWLFGAAMLPAMFLLVFVIGSIKQFS